MLTRQNALNEWLTTLANVSSFTLTPLAGDASFRRYFRLKTAEKTYVVMDAPPTKEGLTAFIHIGQILQDQGVHTPHVFAVDYDQGFALLEDFGDTLLSNGLTADNINTRYLAALDTLITLQECPTHDPLPRFDIPFMQQEMSLFRTWFLEALLDLSLNTREEHLLNQTIQTLSSHLALQPQRFIHRDYHSRNLLILNEQTALQIGVIDFQDAMRGPFTYDLVSLLKDCYLHWPEDTQVQWTTYFYNKLSNNEGWSLSEFQQGVDWCGLQRHFKVLGIFSRLHLRDKKSAYLRDLPLTLHHTLSCLARYDAFLPLHDWMQERILPAFESRQPA